MNYLLDTHALLWVVSGADELSETARGIYLNPANEIYFSVAGLWEMAIKINLGKLKLAESLDVFAEKHIVGNDIKLLNISTAHVLPLATLPHHHRDPFDRLIISQCIQERMQLLSRDRQFDLYPVKRVW